MNTWTAALLGALALALVLGVGVSLVAGGLGVWLGRFRPRLAPAHVASLSLLALALPVLVVSVSLGAAFLPSVLHVLGIAADNCHPGHDHHPHLCPLHPSGVPLEGLALVLGMVGAAWLTLLLVRAALRLTPRRSPVCFTGILGRDDVDTGHRLAVDGILAGRSLPVEWRRSPLPVAGLVGVWRPRLTLSPGLVDLLDPDELRAVLLHEVAHFDRGDLAREVVARMLARLHVPGVGARLLALYREGVEMDCDRRAAMGIGSGLPVASALVRLVAFVRGAELPPALAVSFSGLSLPMGSFERRIRVLVDGQPAEVPGRWLSWVWPCLWVLVSVLFWAHPQVHHALENLLGALST